MTISSKSSDFQVTLCLWHNHRDIISKSSNGEPLAGDWKKVLSHTGSFDQFEYGKHYLTPAPRIVLVQDRHQFCEEDPKRPGKIRQQIGIVCTRKSGVFADDIDHEDEWDRNGIPLGPSDAYTRSGRGHHVLIDARHLRDLWPTQGAVLGGDIKSNGFVAAPESVHFTGRVYEATGSGFVVATRQLAVAHINEPRLKQLRKAGGGGHQLGDGQDDYLFEVACDARRAGLDQDQAREVWRGKASELTLKNSDYPWGDEDFERHWRWAEEHIDALPMGWLNAISSVPRLQSTDSNSYIADDYNSLLSTHLSRETQEAPSQRDLHIARAEYDPREMPKPIRDKRPSRMPQHRDETPMMAFMRRAHNKFCAEQHPNYCDYESCVKTKLRPTLFTWYRQLHLITRDASQVSPDDPRYRAIDPDCSLLAEAAELLLVAVRNNVIELLADLDPKRRPSEFIGWDAPLPTGRPPMAPDDRIQLIVEAAVTRGDEGMSGVTWSEIFNTEHANDRHSHPISYASANRDINRAVEMGLMHIVKPAERHRRGRAWFWTQPVWGAGPTPPDSPEYSRRENAPVTEQWMIEWVRQISEARVDAQRLCQDDERIVSALRGPANLQVPPRPSLPHARQQTIGTGIPGLRDNRNQWSVVPRAEESARRANVRSS